MELFLCIIRNLGSYVWTLEVDICSVLLDEGTVLGSFSVCV
jgi:hypothetical protein